MKTPNPTLAALVRESEGVSWSRAKSLCADGRVLVDGAKVLDPAARVPSGATVTVNLHGPRAAKGPLGRDAVVHFDRDVVVVDKPAGLLSVADEAGNKDTLAEYLRTLLRRLDGRDTALGVVHRLDRETSGLMVFARNAAAHRAFAARFRAHDIERVYHAIAHGTVPATKVESHLLLDRGDGLRGSHGHYRRARGEAPPEARHAVTHVRPLAALREATLLECRLETGRQHQIRIHLAELGHPLLGEKVYIRDYAGARIEAPRVMLHARSLGFVHPATRRAVAFERDAPADFLSMLEKLR